VTTVEQRSEFLTSWVDRLPPRLRRLLPRQLVGFAVIGAFTFSLDLTLWPSSATAPPCPSRPPSRSPTWSPSA
jgi:hypothetical protein